MNPVYGACLKVASYIKHWETERRRKLSRKGPHWRIEEHGRVGPLEDSVAVFSGY